MKALRARGRAMTEAEYLSTQKSYEDTLYAYGLRGSAYDNGDTFTRLIESEVSPRELEERINNAKMVVDSADPNVKRALTEYYGIGYGDLMTYALDPKGVGKDHVEKLARTATLHGIAQTMQLSLSQQYTEQLAMDKSFANSTEADFRSVVSDMADLSNSQRRLAAIDGGTFSDQDSGDIVVKKDNAKILASRQRAAREAARFSGSSGVSGTTLRGRGI